jgi:ubiquinone/menaquinone biosynthesis C-methylase UbiE
MASISGAPQLRIDRKGPLPYLVEYWYLGPAVMRYMVERRFREVLEHADIRPGQRVVEIGCGWGLGLHWARTLGCRVTGIDLSHEQLAWARRNLPDAVGLGLVEANARELPYRDGTFDRVMSVETLEHVFRPDRPRVFAEMARVLKPGGRLALSTPNTISLVEMVKTLATRWPALRRRLPSACFPEAEDDAATYDPTRYHHPPSLAELRLRLREAGFRILGARRFLWVVKVLPDAWCTTGYRLEWLAERIPVMNRLGATTLIWAERQRQRGSGAGRGEDVSP